MKDTLITFETVKLAKKKGIDFRDWAGEYMNLGKPHTYHAYVTQSLLQKWLREKYCITLFVARDGEYGHPDNVISETSKFDYYIQQNNESAIMGNIEFTTYEEALEKGLQEALKLIK